ncbi:hypothetical protein [Bosea vestrisii]|uniref:Uncharacterized protein n=1 Tax=Bosea vestrisii TaxID=151416 RepID=A0ABW0HB90_9HYPH
MKKILIAIARALAAVPKYTLIWCARAGDFVLSMIPSAQPVTTAAGEEANEAVELDQVREERKMARPLSQAHIALAYAAALVTGSRPPRLDGQPDGFVRWLEDLTAAGARRLFKASIGQIEAHLSPRRPEDHLEGVPSIGARPATAAAVGRGSRRENEASVRMVGEILNGVVLDEEGEFSPRQRRRLKAA